MTTDPTDPRNNPASSSLSRAELDSLLARLRNRARKAGLRPNLVLKLYIHERFLARLSSSSQREHFVLKGGLNLYSRFGNAARPTVDVDLVGRGMPNTSEAILQAIHEVMALPLEDALEFDLKSLRGTPIQEEADYGGLRVEFNVRLGRSKEQIRCDISFGAPITPGPVLLEFPALLETIGYPLLGYPIETILAEKIAASVELGTQNTRQKDFYDLYQLATLPNLEAELIRKALERTFSARGTDLGIGRTQLETVAQDSEMGARWRRTHQKESWIAPETFAEVMTRILALVVPLLEGSAGGLWNPDLGLWVENI